MPNTQFYITKTSFTFNKNQGKQWDIPARHLLRVIKVADKGTNTHYVQSLSNKDISFYTNNVDILQLTEVAPSEMLELLYA